MKLIFNSQNTFQGYDARPLKGFFMGSNTHGIAKEIQDIGFKEGFRVFSKNLSNGDIFCSELDPLKVSTSMAELWAQDIWTFCTDKLLAFRGGIDGNESITNFFKIKNNIEDKHLSGGNFFIVDNNGQNEMFIGSSALEKFSLKSLKSTFDVEKIYALPQMDFHIDLFIRPLDKKKILVADDEMSIKTLKKGLRELKNFVKTKNLDSNPLVLSIIVRFEKIIKTFEASISKNTLPKTDSVVDVIAKSGYEPIRVPGRIYSVTSLGKNDIFLSHDCNYINAAVIKNSNEDIIYITNKSYIDKILGLEKDVIKDFEFRFENEFKKSIEPYVKPDKIYYVDTYDNFVSVEMLKETQGGIHCVCAEIP